MKHKDSTPTSVEAGSGGGHGAKPIKEGLVSQIASKFQQNHTNNVKDIPSNPMIVRKKSDSILAFNKTTTSSSSSSIPTAGQKIKKSPGQKNSWKKKIQNQNFFSWNSIFCSFKVFPSSKIDFWPFLKWQKIKKKFLKFIYMISRVYLAWTFFNFLTHYVIFRPVRWREDKFFRSVSTTTHYATAVRLRSLVKNELLSRPYIKKGHWMNYLIT